MGVWRGRVARAGAGLTPVGWARLWWRGVVRKEVQQPTGHGEVTGQVTRRASPEDVPKVGAGVLKHWCQLLLSWQQGALITPPLTPTRVATLNSPHWGGC